MPHKVLVRETIADAGVELLQSKFDVDVEKNAPLESIIGGYDAQGHLVAVHLDFGVIPCRSALMKAISRINSSSSTWPLKVGIIGSQPWTILARG